jgi:HEAT repeat protein
MHIPVELQEALKRGECVIFVGAGFSEGLPTWKELMEPLAEELKMNPDEDPLYIAEYYESAFKRPQLEKMIVDQVNKDVPLTKAHKLLPKLPVKAIITTNYDHLLEKALSKKNFTKIVEGMKAPLIREDQVPLVKMHGDIDDPSTMVITKTDYNEYPEKHRALITYLLGFLISYNFLFVGFGLRDPNFENIYYQIKSLFKDNQRKSYTIVKNPSDYEVESLNRMGIEVIPVDDYDEILSILEVLVALSTEKTKVGVTLRQLESIQNTFREVVERQNKWLDPRGIFQFERLLIKREVELEEIYVVPRLMKQVVIRKRKERGLEKEEKIEKEQKRKIKDEMVTEEIEDYVFEKYVELSIRDALSDTKNSQMVILGDPGIGKSCLLQYIALKASTNAGESLGIERPLLPVLIPLRELPQYGSGKMLKDFILDYIQKRICSLPENVLESFLEKNLFLFLLDGLDEVVSESQRIDVSRLVERFMAQYPHMKIVLTSRPAGYKPAALIGSIPHFTLADFNDEEIREFLVKWFTFLDQIEEEKFDIVETEKKAYDLADIIIKRDRILRLARNPLLLTILVLIHRVGRRLPERRAEFYDFAVRTISGTWETWKNLGSIWERELPDQEIILALLEDIGFRLHNEKQANVVGIEELKIWLEETMEQEIGHSSPKIINDFIWMLKERAGLLVEKGLGLYGFVHVVFQEYFAARYMALGRGANLAENLIKKNLHSGHWREVILLAAAIASPEQADLILDSILQAENGIENQAHSNILCAGLALADQPRISSSKRENIINRLVSLTDSENDDGIRVEAFRVLVELRKIYSFEDRWAVKLLGDENSDIRRQAMEYFTTTGASSSHIQEILLHDENLDVRRQAVAYFTTLGKDDPEIMKEIFRLLRDENLDVRRQAVEYFTTLGKDDPEIMKEIFRLLRDENLDVRRQAVEYFTTLGKDDPEIMKEIFRLLRDENLDVRRQAVTYFTTLGKDDPEIMKEIFRLLRDENLDVRRQVENYFTTMGARSSDIISRLLTDKNPEVRQNAIDFFTQRGITDPEIQKSISRLLTDKNPEVRQNAIDFFTQRGITDPEIQKSIYLEICEAAFELLSNKEEKMRLSALDFLLRAYAKDREAISGRMSLFLEHKEPHARSISIQFFRQINSRDPSIHLKIAQLLEDRNRHVRLEALTFFSVVGITDTFVYEPATQLISDPDASVRSGVVEFLRSEKIRDYALDSIDLLSRTLESEQDYDVKQYIKEALNQLLFHQRNLNQEYTASLLEENLVPYLWSKNESVRKIAREIIGNISRRLLESKLIDSITTWIEKGNVLTFQKNNEFSVCIRTSIPDRIESLRWSVGIQTPTSDSVQQLNRGLTGLLQEYHITLKYSPKEKGDFKVLMSVELGEQERSFIEKVRCIDYNPYRYGGPVREEEMFFGRKDLVEEICQGVLVSNCSIPGERKIGKTSLFVHLEKIMEKPLIPVLVDLATIEDRTFFLTIIRKIHEKCRNIIGAQNTFLFFTRKNYEFHDFEEDLSKLIEQLKKDYSEETKIVLLLDEADNINDLKRITQNRFRSIVTLVDEVSAVITGTLRVRSMSSDQTSPWFNAFMPCRIGPFTREEAAELITSPAEGLYSFSQEAIVFILSKSGCKPWIIQAFCRHAVEKIISENQTHIGIRDVEDIADEVLLKNNFQIYHEKWSDTEEDIRSVLIEIAKGTKVEELCIESKNKLKIKNFVLEGTNELTLEPLFIDWIRRNCL